MAQRRWFILVAGINGAGKSTFTQSSPALGQLIDDPHQSIEVINPDILTREIRGEQPELTLADANVEAAQRSERHLRLLLDAGASVAIETVLSTQKYQPIFDLAEKRKYGILFVYVLLSSVDEAVKRVARRVTEGGHNVAEDKIRSRWPRSLANVPWFWRRATRSLVFFNGGPSPVLLAERRSRREFFYPSCLQVLLAPRA